MLNGIRVNGHVRSLTMPQVEQSGASLILTLSLDCCSISRCPAIHLPVIPAVEHPRATICPLPHAHRRPYRYRGRWIALIIGRSTTRQMWDFRRFSFFPAPILESIACPRPPGGDPGVRKGGVDGTGIGTVCAMGWKKIRKYFDS
jgi:hypothetical protein